ncbi:MAG: serine hydrolase [Leptolyngbyaceae cyanobacterium CRU_2_3]|nr:serine hydrolase [Leptolyngbyaceae cyanobacterium CRU_2_3]
MEGGYSMSDRLKIEFRFKVRAIAKPRFILSLVILPVLLSLGLLSLTGCRSVSDEDLRNSSVPLQAWSAAQTQGKLQPFPPKVTNRLQRLLNRHAEFDQIPGVVLQVATSDGVWMGSAGISDRTNKTPLKPTDRFRIASLTELFVSVVCLQLAEDGKLDLDATIARYLPQEVMTKLENSQLVTVRQLLNHTSGLSDPDPAKPSSRQFLAAPQSEWTAQKVLDFLPTQERAVPKDTFSHASSNYLLLEVMIAQVTGQPLVKVLRDRIFKPLKLNNTFLERREPIPGGFVQGYQDWDEQGKPASKPDSQLDNVTRPLIDTGLGLGDSGIISSASDITRFFQAVFSDNTLLYPNSLNQMLTLAEDGRGGYGLGIRHTMTPWGEGWAQTGTTTGFSSILLYMPVHDLTLVVWSNDGDREDEPYEIAQKSLEIILGKP